MLGDEEQVRAANLYEQITKRWTLEPSEKTKKERNQGARRSRLTFEKAYKAEALDQEL